MTYSDEQKAIIESTSKQVTCIACPGSGKTHTLIGRILHLRETCLVNEKQIVVVTYTVDAAEELRSRLAPYTAIGFIGTMHSYLLRVLNSREKKFTLYSSTTEADLAFQEHVSLCGYKGSLTSVKRAKSECAIRPPSETPQGAELVVRSWYSKAFESGLLDFDSIIYWGLRTLRDDSQQAVHLFWDEAQDMSETDVAVFRAIKKRSYFVVGDPDQSIFGFRGGSPEHLKALAHESDNYLMTVSRRCEPQITEVASALIANEPGREAKQITSSKFRGVTPLVSNFVDDTSEEWLCYLQMFCHISGSVAILVRTNFQKTRIIKLLKDLGIPVAEVTQPTFPTGWIAARYALNGLAFPENDYLAAEYVSLTVSELACDIRNRCAKERVGVNEKYKLPRFESVREAVDAIHPIVGDATHAALLKVIEKAAPESIPELISIMSQIEQESTVQGSGIVVSTMHSAKGREWDNVLIPYVIEEAIPATRDVDEERRLMFVAVTRARSRLELVWFSADRVHEYAMVPRKVNPSRFIAEAGL